MIRIELQIELNYSVDAHGADFIFNVHAAHTACQTIAFESLQLSQAIASEIDTDPLTGNRYLRLRAEPGPLRLAYRATVDIRHHSADPADIAEVPVRHLPPQVMAYVYPSRYCQSDRLLKLANDQFGGLWQGYGRVLAIR
ncbi:MAG: transglutaminase family protein, partial [Burkholderiaceae bacterium]